MKMPPPAVLDRLAGDYVIGSLKGGARRRFEHWMAGLPWLQQRVEEWECRLMPMAGLLSRESAPTGTWGRLERRLFGQGDPVVRSVGVVVSRWPLRLAVTWAAAATLGLLALLATLETAPERLVSPRDMAARVPPARPLALLSDHDGHPALLVSSETGTGRLEVLLLAPLEWPNDRHAVLWARLPDSGVLRLGTLPWPLTQRRHQFATTEPEAWRLPAATSLLLSAEPADAPLPVAPGEVMLSGPRLGAG
ncbi:hypothetical protein OOT46_15650 [Aquabacterium sp. A7-Y]|uniref:hypothetical protein n=1 Tax=Aquabacterium sp. A7-Y TaxID=1349605 RepID=UPI00223E2123|nr:hypothetical protein [Aquabacterium sp. A7-Y]MCW7539278.1 hypothetical protein [Aquabacterium sp. A7-Y]